MICLRVLGIIVYPIAKDFFFLLQINLIKLDDHISKGKYPDIIHDFWGGRDSAAMQKHMRLNMTSTSTVEVTYFELGQ